MAENNIESARATNNQLLEVLYELKKEVALINQKLDNEIVKNDRLLADHESRIRKIEETVWRSAWVSSIVTALITSVAGAVIVSIVVSTTGSN